MDGFLSRSNLTILARSGRLTGRLEDLELPEQEIQRALLAIEALPKPG